MQDWPDPTRFLTVCIEAVHLCDGFLLNCTQQQLFFVMYSFLPDLCPSQEQCTHYVQPASRLSFMHAKVGETCTDCVPVHMALNSVFVLAVCALRLQILPCHCQGRCSNGITFKSISNEINGYFLAGIRPGSNVSSVTEESVKPSDEGTYDPSLPCKAVSGLGSRTP